MLAHLLAIGNGRSGQTYFTERVEDTVSIRPTCDVCCSLHLCDRSVGCRNNVRESSDDLGKRALTDEDERAVDDTDLLSRLLERLRLCGEHLDVAHDLSRRECSENRECAAGKECHGDERSGEVHDCLMN